MPMDKIQVVSVTSREFLKAANKIPNKTQNSYIFQSSSVPAVIIRSPCEVRYAFKRVSRQNPWILPFQSQEGLDLSKEWSFVGNGHKDISPGLNILENAWNVNNTS